MRRLKIIIPAFTAIILLTGCKPEQKSNENNEQLEHQQALIAEQQATINAMNSQLENYQLALEQAGGDETSVAEMDSETVESINKVVAENTDLNKTNSTLHQTIKRQQDQINQQMNLIKSLNQRIEMVEAQALRDKQNNTVSTETHKNTQPVETVKIKPVDVHSSDVTHQTLRNGHEIAERLKAEEMKRRAATTIDNNPHDPAFLLQDSRRRPTILTFSHMDYINTLLFSDVQGYQERTWKRSLDVCFHDQDWGFLKTEDGRYFIIFEGVASDVFAAQVDGMMTGDRAKIIWECLPQERRIKIRSITLKDQQITGSLDGFYRIIAESF